MAGTTLGFLKFVLGFDTIEFKKGMSQAEKDLAALSKKVDKFGKGMSDIGKTMSLAITAPLIAFAGKGIAEAQETAVAVGKVNNALAQTGAVAGQTAPKLAEAADAFETQSLYEADQILADVTTTMLRFGKILPANFQAAQKAALDLAAAQGIDLAAASTLVGKALQDPIKGMKALKAVGVVLTDQEKKQVAAWVESGNAAKAQAFVLEKLNSVTKNAAQAAQDSDPFNKLTDKFNQMAESVGTALLPVLIQLSDMVVGAAEAFQNLDPGVQTVVLSLVAVAAAAGPVLFLVGNLISMFSGVKVLVQFGAGLFGVATAEGAAATGATAAGVAFRAMLGPLALIAAAVTAVYLAWKYWPEITAFVKGVYTAIKVWMVDKLNKVWAIIKDKVDAVTGWFRDMWSKVVGHSYVPDMVDGIAAQMRRLDKEMVVPVKETTETVKQAFADLKQKGIALFRELYPEAASRLDLTEDIKAIRALGLSAAETADAIALLILKRNGLNGAADPDEAVETPAEVYDESLPTLEEVLQEMEDENLQKTTAMAEAWADMASSAISSLRDMVDAFKSGDILGGIQTLLDAVLNLVTALSKAGISFGGGGGGGAAAGGLSYGGARARGGPVVPGKAYTVGENGPEFFSTKRRGFIHPSGRDAQPTRVVVVPSPYFDVRVDQRAAAVAAPMAGQAAIVGVTGSEARMARRSRRNLYATG